LCQVISVWLAGYQLAAISAGLLIEAHPNPKEAMVAGLQPLTPSDFTRLMTELKSIAEAVGRQM